MKANAHGSSSQLRQALLETASQLIDEKGTAGLSIREAARLAGVTHQAPYRHFADKKDLVAAVAEDGFRILEAEIRNDLAKGGSSPWDRIDAVGTAYVRFASEHPTRFRLMFGEELGDKSAFPALRVAADGLFGLVTAAVVDGQRIGEIREGDPTDMALAGWSIMHGLATLLLEGPIARYAGGAEGPAALAAKFIGFLRLGIAKPTV